MATAQAAEQPAAFAPPSAGAGAYLWVSFRHGREGAPPAYWLILPLPPEVRSSPHHIWISMAGITLATLLSAGLLLRQFNRPLRDLAQAARRYAQGVFIEPVPERGPRDVRAVAGQFNRMAEELQRAARDREEMLAGVSHDVRAPLTRMRIRAEMVEDEENRLGLVRDVAEIERITDQFLAFARGDRDGEGATVVDLAELLSSLAQAYQGTGRDVRVTGVGIAHWPLREMAIKRALTNLIENAIHYGAEPIELSADHDGRQLLLNVRDHGAGLSAEACERARRPFVRLDPSRGGQGHSGLGLSIVERIVALHQGSFRFGNAQQGGGVLAQLLLPCPTHHPPTPPQR